MELRHLRYFVAVAEERNFTRASERLFIAQPPLSRQIQLLEHSLGVLLLERNNRQARLTLAGQSFLQDARRILQVAESASQSARRIAHGEAGRLTLGFTAVGAYSMIPRLLVHAGHTLPDIELVLRERVSATQVHDLEAGLIDVGLVRQVLPSARVQYLPIHREPFLAALPAGHPLAARKQLRPSDFDGEAFVMYSASEGRYFHDRIANLFAQHGVQPHYLHQLGQTHSILGLVNVGLGCAVVPASAQALRLEQVVFKPLEGMEQQAEIFLAFCRDNPNPVLEGFVEMARAFFEAE